jgi:hypothetical protein
MTQDWVASFDEAYKNAVIYGTGFIRVSVNGPEGLHLSVVDPKDYFFLGEQVPEQYKYGTPLLDAMTKEWDKHEPR